MKIALVHKRLDKSGGTELDFYRTAAGLRDLGHEVHLFCSELLPKIVPEPDHLFELPDCEIIKDEKKIKVARVKVEIESSVKMFMSSVIMPTLGGIDLAVLWWSFRRLIEAAELGLTRAASRWRHRSCSHPTANHSKR